MEAAKYRKKALRIESQLLGKLAMIGQARFARLIGLNDAQVSRMKVAQGNEKFSFFQCMSMAIAILEYGVDDTEIVELARRFAAVLTKKKSEPARTDSDSQIDMSF
ncbi:MAG: CII family transcriptional regulator [Pantoea sp.]|uniref:CII family transcriptional regulator n=1 Tax=Pantoea sp. TaxID=69393 RepID=UPI0039E5C1EC